MRNLDAYQKSYGTLPFEEVQASYRKRKILESLARHRPRSILEIGCGLDPLFNYYTAFESYCVIEPGDSFAQGAKAQARSANNITVTHGTLEENVARLRTMSFDYIVLSSLLHEVPDSEAFLVATAKLCAPRTIVHVNVPNAHSMHRLLAKEMGIIKSVFEKSEIQKQMQQSHIFDMESLRRLVTVAGFQVIEEGSFFVKLFTHAQMATLQDSGLMTKAMLDGLYGLSKHIPANGAELFMDLKLRV